LRGWCFTPPKKDRNMKSDSHEMNLTIIIAPRIDKSISKMPGMVL
jgi:hypothetical protein